MQISHVYILNIQYLLIYICCITHLFVCKYVLNLRVKDEMNEQTRKEKFCGWYHTHPFDVDVHSNCFLSNTDISTQLQWQR